MENFVVKFVWPIILQKLAYPALCTALFSLALETKVVAVWSAECKDGYKMLRYKCSTKRRNMLQKSSSDKERNKVGAKH